MAIRIERMCSLLLADQVAVLTDDDHFPLLRHVVESRLAVVAEWGGNGTMILFRMSKREGDVRQKSEQLILSVSLLKKQRFLISEHVR